MRVLLDEYMKRLHDRLDEDRLSKLYSAFSLLRDAPRTNIKHELLLNALNNFHEISTVPLGGRTGSFSNNELRCLAHLGMAAAYFLLNDHSDLIAEKLVLAILNDADTAQLFLGEAIVAEVYELQDNTLKVFETDPDYIPASISRMVFSPNGRLLAFMVESGMNEQYAAPMRIGTLPPGQGRYARIEVYDTWTGTQVKRILKQKTEEDFFIAFAPDSKLLAISNWREVRLWDIYSGTTIHTFDHQSDDYNYITAISKIKFSSNGEIIVSQCNNDTLQVWHMPSFNFIRAVEIFFNSSFEISPNGQFIAVQRSTNSGDRAAVTDLKTGEVRYRFKDTRVSIPIFGLNDQMFVVRLNNKAEVWDLGSGALKHVLKFNLGDLRFSYDGETAAAYNKEDDSILVWNTNDWTLKYQLKSPRRIFFDAADHDYAEFRMSIHYTFDNRNVIIKNQGRLFLWDLNTGEFKQQYNLGDIRYGDVLSPSAKTMAMQAQPGIISLKRIVALS